MKESGEHCTVVFALNVTDEKCSQISEITNAYRCLTSFYYFMCAYSIFVYSHLHQTTERYIFKLFRNSTSFLIFENGETMCVRNFAKSSYP